MIHLTIDGKAVATSEGNTILQACKEAGIYVPTLCDHPSIKPYGGCRLCVVEVEGFRTFQTSCTLPASEGMVVSTNTPKLQASRHFVLTMLFSERNHFCMYCQKTNGDCELQNAAYDQDMTHWPIQPNWSTFEVDASHPYFVLDNNRCILCRRCVRACSDLVGNSTWGMENRGAKTMLVADYGLPVGESSCVRCGTCVQICPTGALIDRHSAYLGLDKNTERVESVCQSCSVGCGIEMVVRDNQLVRIDGNWDAPVNNGLLCEAGRYLPLREDRPRITTPLVRKDGELQPASWDDAFRRLAEELATIRGNNGSSVAALASSRLPAEALYAFKSLFCNGLGSSLVTSIEEDLMYDHLGDRFQTESLEMLKTTDCLVVIGADLSKNHQVAGFFVKWNMASGTALVVIDPYENGMNDWAAWNLRPQPGTDAILFEALLACITDPELYSESTALVTTSQVTGIAPDLMLKVGTLLRSAVQPVFLFGKGLTRKEKGQAEQALKALAEAANATIINLRGKANSLAADRYHLTGPFRPQSQTAVYLALGDETITPRLMAQLENVKFLAVQASHASPITDRADVVLPVEMWAEQEGHFLNLDGRLQTARRGLQASGEVRSHLAALQGLAECLDFQIDEGWQAELLQPVQA